MPFEPQWTSGDQKSLREVEVITVTVTGVVSQKPKSLFPLPEERVEVRNPLAASQLPVLTCSERSTMLPSMPS